MKPEISVEDGLAEKVLKELEDELVGKVCTIDNIVDSSCASTVLNQVNIKEEQENIKKNIVKAFVASSWMQRIYFVVRSLMMTIAGAIITLAVFWHFGTINVIEDFLLGLFTYVVCLSLSRLLDTRIVRLSKNILVYLGEHTKLRDFVVKNF